MKDGDLDDADAATARSRMVDDLVAAGDVRAPAVEAALRAVPRHVLVPAVHSAGRAGAAARTVYSDETLLIEAPDGAPRTSSTMPSLLALMIDALDVTGAEHILEIGTGTGYNTALLCHLVGSGAVSSVDVEADLVAVARRRLASLGYRPHLHCGNGSRGLADLAPFDRVLATCAVPRIPDAWLAQLRVGGRMVTPMRRGLAVLDRDGKDRWAGRFHRQPVYFMPLRGARSATATATATATASASGAAPPPRQGDGRRRQVRFGALDTVHHRDVRFLVDLAMPEMTVGQYGPGLADVLVSANYESSASLSSKGDEVIVEQRGPRNLWDEIEALVDWFEAQDRPGRERFGISVESDKQTAWLDEPSGPRWTL